MSEKIFSGGTGPGGAWWGMGCQHTSSAIPVGQDHCSSGKCQRPVPSLLLSPHHGPLHYSLPGFAPNSQPASCLSLLCVSTLESVSAASRRATWQLSLSDLPTALLQQPLAGPSFLEQQDWLPLLSTRSPPGGTSYDIPAHPCAEVRNNCHYRTVFPFRVDA